MGEEYKDLTDVKKVCKSCNKEFTITVRDQIFFRENVKKGYWKEYVEPVRCLDCRKQRRNLEAQTPTV